MNTTIECRDIVDAADYCPTCGVPLADPSFCPFCGQVSERAAE